MYERVKKYPSGHLFRGVTVLNGVHVQGGYWCHNLLQWLPLPIGTIIVGMSLRILSLPRLRQARSIPSLDRS
jgi:hypothetical protein